MSETYDKHGRLIEYASHGKRPDSVGFFWNEPKKIKPPPLVKIKREPPEPTWLNEDFLPGLDEANLWKPEFLTNEDVYDLASNHGKVVFDIELYPNYFLIMFKCIKSDKIWYFEKSHAVDLDIKGLKSLCQMFCIIGFNSTRYDIPILTLALQGLDLPALNQASSMLINDKMQHWQVLRAFKVDQLMFNHIDLIEVAPLTGSLKEYGSRMGTRHLQDLPFAPECALRGDFEAKVKILRYYCDLDLINTKDLYYELEKDIELRKIVGEDYDLDLRSKSDAQIAEAVIGKELERLTGIRHKRPKLDPLTRYNYTAPDYLNFKTDILKNAKEVIESLWFYVGENGHVICPKELKNLKIKINKTEYQLGIGGLHSCENNTMHVSDDDYELAERDVASYYPRIILNLGIFPKHLGRAFLAVYDRIVTRRLKAKANGDTRTANSLKITINGAFGKLGSKWSLLYSPELILRVTLTGQLSLLYLIEMIELAGIEVVSANTDGVVIKCPRNRKAELDEIVKEWERQTRFETDETPYLALLSRDVNNYIAVKHDLSVKGKGAMGRGVTRLQRTQ